VEEISNGVGLTDSELHRTIQSLVDAKLVKKTPTEKAYLPTDTITLNKAFVSKRMKFKVSAALQADTPQQNAETRKLVEDDRKLYLQVRYDLLLLCLTAMLNIGVGCHCENHEVKKTIESQQLDS